MVARIIHEQALEFAKYALITILSEDHTCFALMHMHTTEDR
jgi:hypothetical protein